MTKQLDPNNLEDRNTIANIILDDMDLLKVGQYRIMKVAKKTFIISRLIQSEFYKR